MELCMLQRFRLWQSSRQAAYIVDGAGEPNLDDVEPLACVANIGPRERRRRLRFGVAMLGAGTAGEVLLLVFGAARPWRLFLLLPFAAGASGVFQAREKT